MLHIIGFFLKYKTRSKQVNKYIRVEIYIINLLKLPEVNLSRVHSLKGISGHLVFGPKHKHLLD